MLDPAQKHIGAAQVLDRLGGHPLVRVELAQHVEGARSAHLGPPPAENELLRLDEELDFANAATAELDVVARNGNLVVPADRVDLALHRVNVGDGGVVEVLAPDEGDEIGEKAPAEIEIASGGAGLDQGRALPVLAERLVIGVSAEGGEGDRRRGGIGPEAQVDSEDVPVAGALLQETGERLGDAHEERARLHALGNRRGSRVIEHDEIDVARIVELARAVLTERQDDQARARLRIGRVGIERKPPHARVLSQEKAERRAKSGVGKEGQRLGRLGHVPDSTEVGERDDERRLAL